VLAGGAGDDVIIASQQGSDTMTGNGGSDHFVFQQTPWTPEEITDFTRGVDKIDISALLNAVHYSGTDPIADPYIRLGDNGHGTWVYFDSDGAGTADQWGAHIADLDGVTYTTLTAGDFIIH